MPQARSDSVRDRNRPQPTKLPYRFAILKSPKKRVAPRGPETAQSPPGQGICAHAAQCYLHQRCPKLSMSTDVLGKPHDRIEGRLKVTGRRHNDQLLETFSIRKYSTGRERRQTTCPPGDPRLLRSHCSGAFFDQSRRAALPAVMLAAAVVLATGCSSTGAGYNTRLISPIPTNQQRLNSEPECIDRMYLNNYLVT